MDNLSLLYENKIHGASLIRENPLNEIRYYNKQNNIKQVENLMECLTPSEKEILNQEGLHNSSYKNNPVLLEQVHHLFESGQLSKSQYDTFLEDVGLAPRAPTPVRPNSNRPIAAPIVDPSKRIPLQSDNNNNNNNQSTQQVQQLTKLYTDMYKIIQNINQKSPKLGMLLYKDMYKVIQNITQQNPKLRV